jgi:phospholipid transport system transporter-binding protein
MTDPHAWQFSGELSFATVPALLDQLKSVQHWPTVIDLQNVTRTDSAGLALLIELCKHTREKPVTFRHLPDQLLSLAAVCGVTELLQS